MTEIKDRIFYLVDVLKMNGTIRYDREFYESIGMSRGHYSMAKYKDRTFNLEQIAKIIENYNVNSNWIFGVENNIFRSKNNKSATLLGNIYSK